MSWSERRRFIILCILFGVIALVCVVTSFSIFYKAPTCTDSVKNGSEVGIDCGGSCPYLCTEQVQEPTILFTKIVPNGAGRIDVVASIENKNTFAGAKNIPYVITLYGSDQSVNQVRGVVDLPPLTTVPVYVPGISFGTKKVVRAFLEIPSIEHTWVAMKGDPRVKPVVSNTTIGGTTSGPHITATLQNESLTNMTDVPVIVFVRDAQGEVIAASKTVAQTIPAQSQAQVTFTWNGAFSNTPATIEVLPIIPLP